MANESGRGHGSGVLWSGWSTRATLIWSIGSSGMTFVDHNPPPGASPDIAGIKKAFAAVREAFPDFHATVEDVVSEGDRVAYRWTFRGTHLGDLGAYRPRVGRRPGRRSGSRVSRKAGSRSAGSISTRRVAAATWRRFCAGPDGEVAAMKLVVFGATGGTGGCVVEQALEAGHEVTAVVRDPARLPVRHERLRIVRADVFEPARRSNRRWREPTPRYRRSGRVPTAAGRPSARRDEAAFWRRCRRRGYDGSSSSAQHPIAESRQRRQPLYRFVVRPLLWTIFRGVYEDMALMEEKVRRSDADWTIFRPPRLTDKPRTGRYRTALDRNVPGGNSISRADLADAILHRLEDPDSVRTAIGVGY